GTEIDETKRRLEWPSVRCARVERCLWYEYHLASFGRWIEPFDHEDVPKFRPTAYAEKLESSAKHPVVFERALPTKPVPSAKEGSV
ncbi:hypothetical protein AJ78_08763, partial [Emergomyces pasteurianus Ep9510]